MQVAQSSPSTTTPQVGLDFGHAAAHIGKINPLVRDHPRPNLLFQPPRVADGEPDIETAAVDSPTKPRAGMNLILPMPVGEQTAMTRGPTEAVPFQRRDDAWAQYHRLPVRMNEVTSLRPHAAVDDRKCRAEYRNVGSMADILTEHIGLGPATLIRFGERNHGSLPQGTAKLVMLTLQTQQGFVTGRMFIEKTHGGVSSRAFTPGCG